MMGRIGLQTGSEGLISWWSAGASSGGRWLGPSDLESRTMPPISVLDLAPIPQGATPAEALRRTLDLAQHAEQWGFHRYWLAEHHNMVGIASAATAVVIGYVAGGTRTIRVGAGGIML